MADPTFDSTTFGAAGTHSVNIPPGTDGDSIWLLVSHNDDTTVIPTPTGWSLAFNTVGTGPRMYQFFKDRAGDTSVSFTAAAAGAALTIGFPVPFTGGPLPALQIEAQALSSVEVILDPIPTPAVVVTWPSDGVTPVEEFTLQEYANSAAQEMAAYYAPSGAAESHWFPTTDPSRVYVFAWTWGGARGWTVGRVAWGARSTGWH